MHLIHHYFPFEEKASVECGLEIPSSLSDCHIGSLSNLEELYLDHNKLTDGIPREIGNLVQLQILSLWNNSLTGALFFFLFFQFPLKLSRILAKASLIVFPTLLILFLLQEKSPPVCRIAQSSECYYYHSISSLEAFH